MNKIILFFSIIILFIFSPISPRLKAQVKGSFVFPQDDSLYLNILTDTLETKLHLISFSDTKFYYFKDGEMFVFNTKEDTKIFTDSTKSIAPIGFDKIDFENNTLVLFSYHGGDCHATFRYAFRRDDEAKTFKVKVYVYYGGCRAGGPFKTDWALLPKLPYGYKAEFTQIMVD